MARACHTRFDTEYKARDTQVIIVEFEALTCFVIPEMRAVY